MTAGREFERIEEGFDEADLIAGRRPARAKRIPFGVIAIDRFGQHRVAEAINGVREFGEDGGIERAVVVVEEVDGGLHLAGEFFEDEMLVLHLGRELGGLEDAFAVPVEASDACVLPGLPMLIGRVEPFVEERPACR